MKRPLIFVLLDLGAGLVRAQEKADCKGLVGDSIEQAVSWGKEHSVGSFAGRTVRLRFVMQEADLYSLRFVK